MLYDGVGYIYQGRSITRALQKSIRSDLLQLIAIGSCILEFDG